MRPADMHRPLHRSQFVLVGARGVLYGLLMLTQQPHRESEGAWRLIKMRHASPTACSRGGRSPRPNELRDFLGAPSSPYSPQTTVRDLSVVRNLSVRCRNAERRRKSPGRSHYVVECVHPQAQGRDADSAI